MLLLSPSAVKLHSTHNTDVIYNTHTFKQALLMFQCSVSHSCQSRVHMSSKGQKLLYRRSKPIFQLKALGLSSIVPGRCTFKYKLVLHYCQWEEQFHLLLHLPFWLARLTWSHFLCSTNNYSARGSCFAVNLFILLLYLLLYEILRYSKCEHEPCAFWLYMA